VRGTETTRGGTRAHSASLRAQGPRPDYRSSWRSLVGRSLRADRGLYTENTPRRPALSAHAPSRALRPTTGATIGDGAGVAEYRPSRSSRAVDGEGRFSRRPCLRDLHVRLNGFSEGRRDHSSSSKKHHRRRSATLAFVSPRRRSVGLPI